MQRYRLNLSARSDLRGIRAYLAPAPRPIRLRIIGQIETGFERIRDFPLIGRAEPELSARYRDAVRSTLVHPYRIFYLPEHFPLTVFAILHGAQDIPAILRSRSILL